MKISDLLGEGWEPEEGPDGETPSVPLAPAAPAAGTVGAEPVGAEPAGAEQRSAEHPPADRPLTDRLDDWVMPTPPTPPAPSSARAQLADLAAGVGASGVGASGVGASGVGAGTGATLPATADFDPEPAYEPAVTTLGPVVDDLLPGGRPTGVRKRSKRVASRSGSRRRGR